jgi:hypothetical protein
MISNQARNISRRAKQFTPYTNRQKQPTRKNVENVQKRNITVKNDINERIRLLELRVNSLADTIDTISKRIMSKSRSRSRSRRNTLDSIDRKLMQNSNNIENRHLFPGAIFEAIENEDEKLLGNVLAENSSALNEERNGNHPLEYAVRKGDLPIIKMLVNATPKDQNLDGVITLVLKMQEEKEGTPEEFKYAGIYKYLVLSRKNRNK